MLLYHGSSETVEFPEIRKARFNKDFYFGFYCTQYQEQAARWISRAAFWELARFKYPTHQISFHTVSALDTLQFIKSEEAYGREK